MSEKKQKALRNDKYQLLKDLTVWRANIHWPWKIQEIEKWYFWKTSI